MDITNPSTSANRMGQFHAFMLHKVRILEMTIDGHSLENAPVTYLTLLSAL